MALDKVLLSLGFIFPLARGRTGLSYGALSPFQVMEEEQNPHPTSLRAVSTLSERVGQGQWGYCKRDRMEGRAVRVGWQVANLTTDLPRPPNRPHGGEAREGCSSRPLA